MCVNTLSAADSVPSPRRYYNDPSTSSRCPYNQHSPFPFRRTFPFIPRNPVGRRSLADTQHDWMHAMGAAPSISPGLPAVAGADIYCNITGGFVIGTSYPSRCLDRFTLSSSMARRLSGVSPPSTRFKTLEFSAAICYGLAGTAVL